MNVGVGPRTGLRIKLHLKDDLLEVWPDNSGKNLLFG